MTAIIDSRIKPKSKRLARRLAATAALSGIAIGGLATEVEAVAVTSSQINGCTIVVAGYNSSGRARAYTNDRDAACYTLKSRTRYLPGSGGSLVWGTTTQSNSSTVYSNGSSGSSWSNSVGSSSTRGYSNPVYIY